jgi:hypothetical protein
MPDLASRNPAVEHILREAKVIMRAYEQASRTPQLEAPSREDVVISYYTRLLQPRQQVVDALGRSEGLSKLSTDGPGIVLLIDPAPHANWAHRCWIATFDLGGDRPVRVAEHSFPPREDDECRRIPFAFFLPNGEVVYS